MGADECIYDFIPYQRYFCGFQSRLGMLSCQSYEIHHLLLFAVPSPSKASRFWAPCPSTDSCVLAQLLALVRCSVHHSTTLIVPQVGRLDPLGHGLCCPYDPS